MIEQLKLKFLPDNVVLMAFGEERHLTGCLFRDDLDQVETSLKTLEQKTPNGMHVSVIHTPGVSAALTLGQIFKIIGEKGCRSVESKSHHYLDPDYKPTWSDLPQMLSREHNRFFVILCSPEQVASIIAQDDLEIPAGAILGKEFQIGIE